MTTKVKKIDVETSGTNKIVKVTLEKDGKEYVFSARRTDVMDENKFQNLLKVWNESGIPQQEAEAALSDTDMEVRVGKIKGMKIK